MNYTYTKIEYCDYSANEDMKLRLVATQLMQTQYELSVLQVTEVGKMIDDYLNRKLAIDHLFWGRCINSATCSKSELRAEISKLIILLKGPV